MCIRDSANAAAIDKAPGPEPSTRASFNALVLMASLEERGYFLLLGVEKKD